MTAGSRLQSKRLSNRVQAYVLAGRVGTSTSRLSGIENGYVAVAPEELARLDAAIDAIVAERQRIADLAAREGLSLAGVGL